MTNYSRTTLRELKKRYLNILKKCLLANLLAFSFVLPSMAEEDQTLLDKLMSDGIITLTKNEQTTLEKDENILIDEILTDSKLYGNRLGVVFLGNHQISISGFTRNSVSTDESLELNGGLMNLYMGKIAFDGPVRFEKNKISGSTMNGNVYARGSVIYSIYAGDRNFTGKLFLEGNEILVDSLDGAASGIGGSLYIAYDGNNFKDGIYAKGNKIMVSSKNNTAVACSGVIYKYGSGTTIFSGDIDFIGNSVEAESEGNTATAEAGAISLPGARVTMNGDINFESNSVKAESRDSTAISTGSAGKYFDLMGYGNFMFKNNISTAISINGAADAYGAVVDVPVVISPIKEEDKVIFEKNQVNATSNDGSSKVEGSAIYSRGATSNFNIFTSFVENQAQAISTSNSASVSGGTISLIQNPLTFETVEFKKNKSIAKSTSGNAQIHGGVVNYGYDPLTIKESARFIENEIDVSSTIGTASLVGGILKDAQSSLWDLNNVTFEKNNISAKTISGNVTLRGGILSTAYATGGSFKGETIFDSNVVTANSDRGNIELCGGVLFSQSSAPVDTLDFNSVVSFQNNQINAFSKDGKSNIYGGLIYLGYNEINFNKYLLVTNNSISLDTGNKNGGINGAGIYNKSIINFNSNFDFKQNKSTFNGVEVNFQDIYNYADWGSSGTINFAHGYADDGVTPLIGSLDGGIHNAGIINKTGAGTLILGDEMVNSGTGTFNQSAGLTIAHTDHFLTGTNNITGGELRVHGANMDKLKATVGGDALLTFLSTSTSEIEMKLGKDVSVAGDVKFGADESIGTAKYHLKDDIEAKKIIIENADVTTENETFEGVYVMGENVTLDMQDGEATDRVEFTNLTGSANLKIDADIVNGANGLELVTDQIATNSDATLKLALTDVILSENALDNGLSDSYTATVMIGGTLTYGSEKGLVATDIYSYEVSGANNQITIDAMKFNEDSDVMKSVAEFDGDAAFNMTIGGDSYEMKSDVVMTKNTKSIVGKGKETSTLTAKKITVTGATLNVENVSVSGENQLIDVESGTLNVTNAKVENIENAGEATLDTAEVSELENSGTLTANGSTIGALVNEKDATITGGELETATNKEKGMLSLTAGLRAGTVTNEGELTLDAVTVADLTNSATLKTNGSTVQKLVNEQEAELTASTVEDLTNMGTLTAKDLTLKGALKGSGTATLSGKLVADDIFKSENKIISDGMEVSENIQKMELADLEIKEGTTLDIGTREVTAKEVSVGDKATLQVTLNGLDDHGTMKADKIEAGARAGVHLVLGEKFEGGVFDVFQGTKGAGDLEVKHNNLYNVIEVEEGKYSFMTKDTEALQESLGATKEEVSVADAMTKGTSTNPAFNKMQSEMLIALQSLETDTVAKAKKALSAVGAKEQPIEQSVASEHLVALQNVVQAELHGTTVGHSGGDTDPRAKVYIKGLYDRTKSSMGEGFKARSKGVVLGVQSEVTEDLTLGVGYATSQTTAKEDLRRTEVDTNTGFISAHYQPNAWWVSGLATFSRGEYEEEKQVLSSTGKATYDVDSWGAQVMTGYDIKLENAIITPEVGLRYLSVKQEGYTDTLGTTVSGTQSDYLTALVGVKGTWDMGAIRPTAAVTVGYDIISDDVSALNTLANGASYTVNGEALERLSTTITTGIEADLGERTTLKLEYSGTFRKEYADHSGMLKLEMRF